VKVLLSKEFRSKLEEKTIELFKKNEILDIERVIESYSSYIYKMLTKSIANEADIEEIVSDVFIIFWKNYQRLENTTPIKPYLVGITKNLIKRKYKEYNIKLENVEMYEETIAYHIDLENLVEGREKSKIISETLNKIKEEEQTIFILFYYKQQKIKDIAKVLKISEAKVKIVLFRIRKLIKKNLKGYYLLLLW